MRAFQATAQRYAALSGTTHLHEGEAAATAALDAAYREALEAAHELQRVYGGVEYAQQQSKAARVLGGGDKVEFARLSVKSQANVAAAINVIVTPRQLLHELQLLVDQAMGDNECTSKQHRDGYRLLRQKTHCARASEGRSLKHMLTRRSTRTLGQSTPSELRGGTSWVWARLVGACTFCASREEIEYLACEMFSFFAVSLLVLYLPICKTALEPWRCVSHPDGNRRMALEDATTIVCSWSDPLWAELASAGLVMGSIYIILIPLSFAALLTIGFRLSSGHDCLGFRATRFAGMHDTRFERALQPLYRAYHYHAYLWEPWLLLRKLLLVMSLDLLHGRSELQLACVSVLLTSGAGLQLSLLPYISHIEHKLEMANGLYHLSSAPRIAPCAHRPLRSSPLRSSHRPCAHRHHP